MRARSEGPKGALFPRDLHREEARRPVRASHGVLEKGPLKTARRRRTCGGPHPPHGYPSPTIPPRICCMRRCAGAGHPCRAEGSSVEPGRLRFDFSHNKPMSAEEIARVEDIANAVVLQNEPVITRLMAVDEAIASGAMALFARNMAMRCALCRWHRPRDGRQWRRKRGQQRQGLFRGAVRRNACAAHGRYRLVKVLSEGAVAAGVRRVEAITADAARHYLSEQMPAFARRPAS